MRKIFYIDLFSGAGGTTTGIHLTNNKDIKVVACVNHDEKAIQSHKANHPECIHFVEDVRDFNVVLSLKNVVSNLRRKHPGCIINIWASLECTNYSKAKGGLPRDADSRTLANALFMYLEELDPDYVFIENVVEFMAWGPLDNTGRPVCRKNGRDYLRWQNKMKSYGYYFEHAVLNSADYGAYTSRARYFGQFAKLGMPISWPAATHTKNPKKDSLFEALDKWKPVREVLDLDDEGKSIFTRKKPLVEATLKRIYAGLIKFVAGGEDLFIKKYYSGRPAGKVISVTGPAGTITTIDSQAIVKCVTPDTKEWMLKYNSVNGKSGKHNPPSIDDPCPVVSTQGRLGIVKSVFLHSYYGNGGIHKVTEPCPTLTTKDRIAPVAVKFFSNYYTSGGRHSSIDKPCPTLTGVPKQRLVSCQMLDQQYGKSKPQSVDKPANTITANPKLNVISVKPWLMDTNFNNIGSDINEPSRVILANRKWHYLMNPQYKSKGRSLEDPCFTLIARMDKRPPYLISTETGDFGIVVYENDSETMVVIKEFMAIYGIIDIKMRMLKIDELLKIQGFPINYKLIGTKTDQKKFIGNAVVPVVAMKIAEANSNSLANIENRKLA